MTIRQARFDDLQEIAQVHIACFPDSFSTQLGKYRKGFLQQRFYLEYLKDVPELFLVAVDETLPQPKIVGFCMGYYLQKNDYMRSYLKNNWMRIGLRMCTLLLMGNAAAWQKILRRFKKGAAFQVVNEDIVLRPDQTGDLLSICVLPQYRGSDAAQRLIEGYEAVLRENGKKMCVLTVAVENGRGVRFYERNGYVPYKEAGKIARTYVKQIGTER